MMITLGKQRRPSLFLVLSTLLVLLAGSMALLLQSYQEQKTRANGDSFIGPPTLPAETVDKIFARMGSPMVGTGKVVEQASRQANIDDAFALAVWWVETSDGAAGVGRADYNPGSVRGSAGYPAAFDGYTVYASYAEGITDWFSLLRSRYVDRGLTSVYTLSRPYVGTSSSDQWAAKVVNYMLRYRSEAPPPGRTDHVAFFPGTSTTQSFAQAKRIPRNEPAPAPTTSVQPGTNTPASVMPGLATLLPTNQLLLIVTALLAALVLAMLGLKMRRGIPVVPAVMTETLIKTVRFNEQTNPIHPITPTPALYFNEYSPIAGPVSAPELPFAFWQEPGRKTQALREPQPVGPISSADGFASSHISTNVSLPGLRVRHLIQVAASAEQGTNATTQVPDEREQSFAAYSANQPTTEALPPYRPGLFLPGRMPHPVGVGASTDRSISDRTVEPVAVGAPPPSGGGLLRRYGSTANNEK